MIFKFVKVNNDVFAFDNPFPRIAIFYAKYTKINLEPKIYTSNNRDVIARHI